MVIKVYVAMISCSQEIKKNQQRTIMILESKNIPYTIIDITDPANEDSKDYMVETATPKEGAKIPVTPQLYNEAEYCGDYDGLDMANECDTLGDFLKLTEEEKKAIKIGITGIIPTDNAGANDTHITNGLSGSREATPVEAAAVPTDTSDVVNDVEAEGTADANHPNEEETTAAEVTEEATAEDHPAAEPTENPANDDAEEIAVSGEPAADSDLPADVEQPAPEDSTTAETPADDA